MVRFDCEHVWEDLMVMSGRTAEECVAILEQWGVVEHEGLSGQPTLCGDGVGLADVDFEGDFEIYLDGFWTDETPVIEIEDGYVARWYRAEAWD